MAEHQEKTIQEELSFLILMADRVIKTAKEVESTKVDCSELPKHATGLAQALRSIVRIFATTTTASLYEPPIRRITADVSKNLERSLTLLRKCKKHSGVLRQVFAMATTADFRKVSFLIESSIADIEWLLSVFDFGSGISLSLPPMASNDPMLAWVWSYITSVQMGHPGDRVDAANELASLALDNDRNKKIIVAEGGIVPLLKLLREGASPEAQIAAATALYNLATDAERVRLMSSGLAVPIIVKVLGDSPMRVQVPLVSLVARMAEIDPGVQEELGGENVARPLVTLLSMDTNLDHPIGRPQSGMPRLQALVEINREIANNQSLHSNSSSNGNSRGGHYRKEREVESPELKLKLKINCALALWKLSRGSLLNSRKITETKALLCLAKHIEKESGELLTNCLMTVMELAAVAESNPDLRRAAFKLSSPTTRAVLDQLLRVVNEVNIPALLIPAIKVIGSLSRNFPAKETRTISPLVAKLGHRNSDVAIEAAIALEKFVCPDNFNRVEHSRVIIDFDGVSLLINLLRSSDRGQVHELKLLCYLALNVGDSKALEQSRVLNVLEGAARFAVAQHPDLKELFAKAMHHLTLYQPGAHTHRQPYAT